ncbi:MAG: hypothetical protein U1E38_03435 [Rhodospirillales bacterium]
MARRGRVFRLLPALLAAAVLLLGVKVHDVARLLGEEGTSLAITPARAETGAFPPPEASRARPPAAEPAAAGEGHGATRPAAPAAASKPAPPPSSASPPAASALAAATPAAAGQAAAPSAEELQVLQRLSARRQALDARAEELDRRADLLHAGEARLDQKLQEMKEMQALLQGLLKGHDAQQEAQIRSLVKIYENMKPRDAARIFEELEMATLLPVVERMGERRLAPVMADMNPAKARKITEELVRLRQLSRPAEGG